MPIVTKRYGKEAYEFRENSIVVKIPFNWINVMGDKVGDNRGDKIKEKTINATQIRILTEIRNNPNITKPHLAEALGLSKTTIDNGISALKKYGFIERIGRHEK